MTQAGLRAVASEHELEHDGADSSTEIFGPVSDLPAEGALEALLSALRLNVGRGGRFGVDQLAEAVGMTGRKLRAIMDREQRPSFEDGVRLMTRLGPITVNAVIAPFGYAGAHRAEPADCRMLEAVCNAGRIATEFAAEAFGAAADATIDTREEPALLARAARMIEEGKRLDLAIREAQRRRRS